LNKASDFAGELRQANDNKDSVISAIIYTQSEWTMFAVVVCHFRVWLETEIYKY